ncbi:MAG: L,D-transpeptidase family protein [Chloroflexota bacterium]
MTSLPPSDPTRQQQAQQAVRAARQALQRGETGAARRLAAQAAALAPELEDAWLLLAAVASPRASVEYLERALQINPGSRRARTGMHWAVRRLREAGPGAAPSIPATAPSIPAAPTPVAPVTPAPARRRPSPAWLALALLLGLAALFAWNRQQSGSPSAALAKAQPGLALLLASETPTASATATATATDMPTATHTPSPTASQTSTATATASQTASPTPQPSQTPTALPSEAPSATPSFTAPPELPAPSETPRPKKRKAQAAGPQARPARVSADERWIDVDLSSQTTYAMQGDQVVKSFIVSTGKWPTVTVTGVYRIYVKYESTDMWGADYYLSGVPYVMYFYEGYGLHGTYWHSNFGHPMSHGCINLSPEEAGWLFEFASVGTVVSIHD